MNSVLKGVNTPTADSTDTVNYAIFPSKCARVGDSGLSLWTTWEYQFESNNG